MKICKHPGCDTIIGQHNVTGLCKTHIHGAICDCKSCTFKRARAEREHIEAQTPARTYESRHVTIRSKAGSSFSQGVRANVSVRREPWL